MDSATTSAGKHGFPPILWKTARWISKSPEQIASHAVTHGPDPSENQVPPTRDSILAYNANLAQAHAAAICQTHNPANLGEQGIGKYQRKGFFNETIPAPP